MKRLLQIVRKTVLVVLTFLAALSIALWLLFSLAPASWRWKYEVGSFFVDFRNGTATLLDAAWDPSDSESWHISVNREWFIAVRTIWIVRRDDIKDFNYVWHDIYFSRSVEPFRNMQFDYAPRIHVDARFLYRSLHQDIIYQLAVPHWMYITFFGAYPSIVLVAAIRRRFRKRNPNGCKSCGYDLTGNESGVCPECGKPTSENGVPSNNPNALG